MQLTVKFATIASLLIAALAAPTTSTVNVVNDLQNINNQMAKFINDMNSFNGGLAQALAINDDATNLSKLIKSANADVRAQGPISESDASALLNIAEQTTVPDVESVLKKLVDIKGPLTKIPGASILVSRDLADMGTSSVALMESLKSGVPDDLKVKVQGLKDRMKTAIRKADSAYGVNPGF